MTVSTPLMQMICRQEQGGSIVLADGLRLQVIPSIADLAQCQKHQFAAFIADRGILVVWDDDPYHLVERVSTFEKQLLRKNWGAGIVGEEKAADEAGVTITEVAADGGDHDAEAANEQARPTRFQAPIMVSCTLALLIAAFGFGWRQIANEFRVDSRYGTPRLALLTLIPLQTFLSLVRPYLLAFDAWPICS